MEKEQELAIQKSGTSLTATKLNNDQSIEFVAAVKKLSLAKNISLAPGTLSVWEECMLEDISSGIYDYEDFILATKRLVRDQLYNRIDFADIYEWAKGLAEKRRLKIKVKGLVEKRERGTMPSDVKGIISQVGTRI